VVFNLAHGSETPYAGLAPVVRLLAIFGASLVALLVLAVFAAAKRPIPVLTLSDDGMTTELTTIPWSDVRGAAVERKCGLSFLAISMKDRGWSKGKPAILRYRYAVRQWLFGCPILIPEVREASLEELAAMVARYQSAAGNA
jgi:hypothetical protein